MLHINLQLSPNLRLTKVWRVRIKKKNERFLFPQNIKDIEKDKHNIPIVVRENNIFFGRIPTNAYATVWKLREAICNSSISIFYKTPRSGAIGFSLEACKYGGGKFLLFIFIFFAFPRFELTSIALLVETETTSIDTNIETQIPFLKNLV